MRPSDIDTLLAAEPWFAALRPDERLRIAARLPRRTITAEAPLRLAPDDPALLVVLDGEPTFDLDGDEDGAGERLFPGDAVGALGLATGRGPAALVTVGKEGQATLLTCDRPTFARLLVEYPAMAPPLLAELARELKWKNDLLREVSLAHAEGLPREQLAAVLASRRHKLEHRRRGGALRATRQLARRLVVEPGREPAFWALLGFVLALCVARAVVGGIIATGAQKHFFALIGGANGNPIHIHHFNYGIVTVVATGIAALHPRARRWLRLLGFTFGFGCGLVTDEFALLWNLDPDYYQGSSRVAMLVVGGLLAQLVYLRALWVELGRRAVATTRSFLARRR